MQKVDLITQAAALTALYKDSCRTPFPYNDVRKLLEEVGRDYPGLSADLDLHFSTIAGYCAWGRRLLKWEDETVNEVVARLDAGFFDKHPKYKPLESMITQPNLKAQLSTHERMRTELLRLLKRLRKERPK